MPADQSELAVGMRREGHHESPGSANSTTSDFGGILLFTLDTLHLQRGENEKIHT